MAQSNLFPDIVASAALNHYFEILPKKGKPTPGKEWSVYAAIIATRSSTSSPKHQSTSSAAVLGNDAWVVSCATGSKCTSIPASFKSTLSNIEVPQCMNDAASRCTRCCQEQIKGFVLHDSHAEILARRGLIRTLWKEIHDDLDGEEGEPRNGQIRSNCLLQRITKTSGGKSTDLCYELKTNIQLHLYISDSPCGDASIYDILSDYGKHLSEGGNVNFTGAKIIVPSECSKKRKAFESSNLTFCGNVKSSKEVDKREMSFIARERLQITSALRLKSGRSNLPAHMRCSSMSCSDKLCKWSILGLQGSGFLSCLLKNPIRLTSIVVSKDPRTDATMIGKQARSSSQLGALERALVERANKAMKILPNNLKSSLSFCMPKVYLTDIMFPQGKAASESDRRNRTAESLRKKQKSSDEIVTTQERKNKQHIPPIGISINWQICDKEKSFGRHSNVEQTVGARGVKQGKKLKKSEDLRKNISNLSRWSLFQDSLKCMVILRDKEISLDEDSMQHLNEFVTRYQSGTGSYQMAKKILSDKRLKLVKEMIFSDPASPLSLWVNSSKDNDFKCLR